MKLLWKNVHLCSLLYALCSTALCWGTTYYVDVTNGHDINSGTSQTAPWRTIAKVNSTQFQPGDFILFKRGEIWREKLIIPSSGSAAKPIIYATYGTGSVPIVNGSDIISGNWSGPNAYDEYTDDSVDSGVYMLVVDGKVWSQGTAGDLAADEWDWIDVGGGTLFLGSDPSGLTVEAGQREGILVEGKEYIIIDGLKVTHTQGNGPTRGGVRLASGCAYVTVQNCTITDNNNRGINVSAVKNCTIYNNTISGVYKYPTWFCGDGIGLHPEEVPPYDVPTNVVVSNNTIIGYFVRWPIFISGSKDCTISGNTIAPKFCSAEYQCFGIDIEPNAGQSTWIIDGLTISNNTIEIDDSGSAYSRYGISTNIASNSVTAVNISGNTIDMGGNDDTGGIVLDCDSGTCNATGNTIQGVKAAGIQLVGPATFTVARNSITMEASRGATTYGIITATSSTVNVNYNIVKGGDRGFMSYGATKIYNNVFYDFASYGIYNQGSDLILQNNVFLSTKNDILLIRDTAAGTSAYDYNLYYSPNDSSSIYRLDSSYSDNLSQWQTALGGCPGNGNECNSKSLNPLFLNASNDELTLKRNSPCIDAGIDVGLTLDRGGNVVPRGGGVDIGAFEYEGLSSPKNLRLTPK